MRLGPRAPQGWDAPHPDLGAHQLSLEQPAARPACGQCSVAERPADGHRGLLTAGTPHPPPRLLSWGQHRCRRDIKVDSSLACTLPSRVPRSCSVVTWEGGNWMCYGGVAFPGQLCGHRKTLTNAFRAPRVWWGQGLPGQKERAGVLSFLTPVCMWPLASLVVAPTSLETTWSPGRQRGWRGHLCHRGHGPTFSVMGQRF